MVVASGGDDPGDIPDFRSGVERDRNTIPNSVDDTVICIFDQGGLFINVPCAVFVGVGVDFSSIIGAVAVGIYVRLLSVKLPVEQGWNRDGCSDPIYTIAIVISFVQNGDRWIAC